MESQLDPRTDQVIITLTHQECITIRNGGSLTDRENPFDPLAKVDVRPLSDIDLTYRPLPAENLLHLSRMREIACRAIILRNNDIIVYVPEDLAGFGVIAAEDISADKIEGLQEVIPDGGIRIEFGETVGRRRRESRQFEAELLE